MEARATTHSNPFADADAWYATMKAKLGSTEALQQWHGDLEETIAEQGRELHRLLLQGVASLHEGGQPVEPVVGADGVERTQRRCRSRQVSTIFGRIEVARMCCIAPSTESLAPLDGVLNLPSHSYSHGLRRLVARHCATMAFETTIDFVQDRTGVAVPKRQTEGLARAAAVDFDAFYESRQAIPENDAERPELLVISTDGKGVTMIESDLRPATREAAQKERARKTGREKPFAPKGGKRRDHRTRMAQVAVVYGIERHPRTAEDIVRELDRDEVRWSDRPKPNNKRTWASLAKDSHEVIEDAFREADRRDPKRQAQWVILIDGLLHQLDVVLELVGRYNPNAVVVLDLVHVLEKLWAVAAVLRSETDREDWVAEKLLWLLQGRTDTVASAMRRSATKLNVHGKSRKLVDDVADYLLEHAEFLQYDRCLRDGLPIATGVVEGACRHLIGDRMEITGARWGLATAEAVLRLRALLACGDFDEYWRFHAQREHARNHLARYARQRIPAVAELDSKPTAPRSRNHLRLVSS